MRFLRSKRNKIQGFIYVVMEENSELFEMSVGETYIKPDRQPPWIVVNHDLDSVLVTKWPGKLLKVEVLDEENERDLNKGLKENVHYTRTLGVQILEERPCSELFNPKGEKITEILDFIRTMVQKDADELLRFDLTEGYQIYSDSWNHWLRSKEPSSYHLNQFHASVTAIYANNAHTTLNKSFSVISNILWKRAKELLGDAAFTLDEDGEYTLNESWSHASDALKQAAMAYHGGEFTSSHEQAILLKPWRSLVNRT